MEADYDRKFDEMKQYIPFLDGMIKRLESTGKGSLNPRLAQLNKIRSLRDLLSDKKKRMRMENLLKCEQVLLNLYAKVEQGNALPNVKPAPDTFSLDSPLPCEKADLETVRSKLKKVTAALEGNAETLPEIARASEIEETCASGSKEPALFQRRPQKSSKSPSGSKPNKSDGKSPQKSAPKRNYTRVLVSPERSEDQPLYSRRSPRSRSPKSRSQSYKKERKKSSNHRDSNSTKTRIRDLNITLNVPEDRLHSINTEDILTRIINCHGSDVDIDTLKDLRSQIINELQDTGSNDDITHLLLKSYKKSSKKKEEVEDGEICDSENEAIESIYGGLVTIEKAKNTSTEIKTLSADKRKVQICLRINSEKEKPLAPKLEREQVCDPDFESFDIVNSADSKSKVKVIKDQNNVFELSQPKVLDSENQIKVDYCEITKKEVHKAQSKEIQPIVNDCFDILTDKNIPQNNMSEKPIESPDPVPYKPNFYKPINDKDNQTLDPMSIISNIMKKAENKSFKSDDKSNDAANNDVINQEVLNKSEVDNSIKSTTKGDVSKSLKDFVTTDNASTSFKDKPKVSITKESSSVVKIPLLNEEPVVPNLPPKVAVSEIDILQALKNEILGESIATPGSETITPALHQPKLSKVENAKAITQKKRISIETYKEKSSGSPKQRLSRKVNISLEDSNSKKPSLKLTEKECERFNFPSRLSLDDSSDDDCEDIINIYEDFGPQAPKSPETEDTHSTDNKPIIIPVDPVKTPIANTKSDIDMRKLLVMPNVPKPVPPPLTSPIADLDAKKPEQVYIPPPVDPRRKRDVNMPFNTDSFNSSSLNADRTPRSLYPNMTPNRTPTMTPNRAPNMTPNRTFELTPSHKFYNAEENSGKKHVYTPMFTNYDKDGETSVSRDHVPVWEKDRSDSSSESRDTNKSRVWDDPRSYRDSSRDYNKSSYNDEYQRNPRNDRFKFDRRGDYRDSNQSNYSPAFGRLDCPSTPVASFDVTPMTPVHPFGRSDCPRTPSHPFGRSDCPPTPNHSFGRSDMPLTPSHPFGRTDVPLTPSHPFGRSEAPMTPSHPFGRSETPMTPSHPFGRTEAPMTPIHPFGRSDYTQNVPNKTRPDPRLIRMNDEKDSRYYDKRISDSSNRQGYGREKSQERFEKSYEQVGRPYREYSYREQSVGRSNSRDHGSEQYYRSNIRSKDYEREEKKNETPGTFQRDRSVGRSMRTEDNFYQPPSTGNVNKMSVTPHAGRSFTIDTSVSRTFQEFLDEKGIKLDYPLKTRRERATSVGRSLIRESSVERTHITGTNIYPLLNKRNNFERARSVGRELAEKGQKSFNEIKADFRSYSFNYNKKSQQPQQQVKKMDKYDIIQKSNFTSYMKPKYKQDKYSPRKNNRDPRMHRDGYKEDSKHRNKERERKKYGIDYSHDNIIKGTMLGSGYGVKNYKIPKIKKPVEEKVEESLPPNSKVENVKVQDNNVSNKQLDFKVESSKDKTQTVKSKKINEDNEISEKRPTRSSAKEKVESKFNKYEQAVKVKKSKKVLSDSDLEAKGKNASLKKDNISVLEAEIKTNSIKDAEGATELEISQDLDKDDDIINHISKLFPDDMESDQIEDLDALIAGLEQEIDNTKHKNPSTTANDTVFDSLFEDDSIIGKTKSTDEKSLKEILGFDDTYIQSEPKSTAAISLLSNDKSENISKINSKETVLNEKPTSKREIKDLKNTQPLEVQDTQAIVSTTDEKECKNQDKIEETSNVHFVERSSTPDSTINNDDLSNNEVIDKKIPVSIEEPQKEMHSDVTSTHDTSENSTNNKKPANIDSPQADNSIGNLLSILQDKSRIRELVSMLGDQENEKLKKQLEKLSEIVESDEEETPVEVPKAEDEGKEKVDPSIKSIESQDAAEVPEKTDNTPDVENFVAAEEKLTNEALSPEPKKRTFTRRGKGRLKKVKRKMPINTGKRVTRSNASLKNDKKRPSRELRQLQNDIKEMFISNDILNATGIRMCRLAKLVDEKAASQEDEPISDKVNKPVVVLEKITDNDQEPATTSTKSNKTTKKPGGKQILKSPPDKEVKTTKCKQAIGPKSKVKSHEEDLYEFHTDTYNDKLSNSSCSESENESFASSKSLESSEVLSEVKKKMKRKRPGWKAGVISSRKKKKVEKIHTKSVEPDEKASRTLLDENVDTPLPVIIPDMNCFTDKNYCFLKNVSRYSCRLCHYSGNEIVNHYKRCHPHSEIPLSRMSPEIAKQAIDQSGEIDFEAVSKVHADKYTCRFCFKEFILSKKKNFIEAFFWHVVSTHTGEYKQLCSECVNVTRCPFNLDIPPPPKDMKGQLIGYICAKCNFTQISLENLKTHVIVRHNDEQTAVYTVNLSMMSKKTIKAVMAQSVSNMNENTEHRVLRSSRSNQSAYDASDDHSEFSTSSENISEIESLKIKLKQELNIENLQTKITFESDEVLDPTTVVKSEPDAELDSSVQFRGVNLNNSLNETTTDNNEEEVSPPVPASDFIDCTHFKITLSSKGMRIYVCCINGEDDHFRTNLVINMKKHIQTIHKENWDGYCSVCKVIVTAQGKHNFKECFQHFQDHHMDDFPVYDDPVEKDNNTVAPQRNLPAETPTDRSTPTKSFINVRPLSELMTATVTTPTVTTPTVTTPTDTVPTDMTPVAPVDDIETLPVIESVVSLGNVTAPPASSPKPDIPIATVKSKQVKKTPEFTSYEEAQQQIMTMKNDVVLENMMSPEKLVKIFKCAGRFCCFTTDSMEDALQHASTHKKVGGENSLKCAYCDYNCAGNAINLIVHLFKYHGSCQYSCPKCFYRSAGSHLVYAHMLRMHEGDPAQCCVLETSTVTPSPDESTELLSREESVAYYICGNSKTCGHKSYAQGKFCELLMRHPPPYKCYLCCHSELEPKDLLNHMKIHGLNMMQCTWCGFGADNEAVLVDHTSQKHPHRQPQAYVRIITVKSDPKKLTVLPLAKYLNSCVKTKLVSGSSEAEHPVREAERAFELEQLIGSLPISDNNIVVKPVPNKTIQADEAATSVETMEIDNVDIPIPEEVSNETINLNQNTRVTLEEVEHQLQQSRISTSTASETEVQIQPLVKIEPTVVTAKNIDPGVIICLDSDEEDAPVSIPPTVPEIKQPVVDTNVKKNRIVSPDQLYKCPKCPKTTKSKGTIKRHFSKMCFKDDVELLKCPHCDICMNASNIFSHYDEHINPSSFGLTPNQILYACDICDKRHISLALIKTHIIKDHGHGKTTIKMITKDNGDIVNNVILTPARTPSKRKLSSGNIESPSKKKYYGPQDINELPPKPILDDVVHCKLCEFNCKVRLNMVRHLQMHADKQPVPQTVPLNPVPHLETNEKHFDKMINLASSSLVTRPDKPPPEVPSVRILVTPEQAAHYPKYVPKRERLTCGAKECTYTSVDEETLKLHWEALHAGTNNYHCHHCPPSQYLDTSKPLTFSRVISHLKMHDANLYACSICPYYHYKKQVVEKHLMVVHKGSGQPMIVREECNILQPQSTMIAATAPTMDLKPWQCGLCQYKNMLRQEVIEHCSKIHNTKMQFKCPNCPMKTSTIENITNHRSNKHPGSSDDVIYYYYREGTVPIESDGTPLWVKQCAIVGHVTNVMKTEVDPPPQSSTIIPSTAPINLDIVKQEVEDPETSDPVQMLIKKFGEFCEPNGVKYTCPLCKVVSMDTKQEIQSHLFEELKYRKWGCSMCSYKAFHRTGLSDHMTEEHYQNRDPIELPMDNEIETWVSGLTEYQTKIIEKTKEDSVKQKDQAKPQSQLVHTAQNTDSSSALISINDSLKAVENPISHFSCPECDFKTKDESAMRDHLENELNRLRWVCSVCQKKFQQYHQAQFHCKEGFLPKPLAADRDPAKRAAWVSFIIDTQKSGIPEELRQNTESSTPAAAESSLLVVRYEEHVPTPEEEMRLKRRNVNAHDDPAKDDSDDEKLTIDDTTGDFRDQNTKGHKCPHCDFTTKMRQTLFDHSLRHYNLKPFSCGYCNYNGYHQQILKHHKQMHPTLPMKSFRTPMPDGPAPVMGQLSKTKKKCKSDEINETKEDDGPKVVCLTCEKAVLVSETHLHVHENEKPVFRERGQVVVKCCICLSLVADESALTNHNDLHHPNEMVNYAYHKLNVHTRELYCCDHCFSTFTFIRDLKTHHNHLHRTSQLKYTMKPYVFDKIGVPGPSNDDDQEKKKLEEDVEPAKKVAKKSTTKLPGHGIAGVAKMVARKSTTKMAAQAVAKKSTTKLPLYVYSDSESGSEEEEYSYYGTKPTPLAELSNITTMMPFFNSVMPFTLKNLSEIIQINPIVLVEDIKK